MTESTVVGNSTPDRKLLKDLQTDEVRYIYRKLGNLEAQVSQAKVGTEEAKQHSVETRAMLNEHIAAVRESNRTNDTRWKTIETQLEAVSAIHDMHRTFKAVTHVTVKGVQALKTVAVIAGLIGVIAVALKAGDVGTAKDAVDNLIKVLP